MDTRAKQSRPWCGQLPARVVLAGRRRHADGPAGSAVGIVRCQVRADAGAIRVRSGARARTIHAREISAAARAAESAVGLVGPGIGADVAGALRRRGKALNDTMPFRTQWRAPRASIPASPAVCVARFYVDAHPHASPGARTLREPCRTAAGGRARGSDVAARSAIVGIALRGNARAGASSGYA